MPDSQAKVKMVAEPRDLFRAYAELQRKIDKNEQAMRKLKTESRKAGRQLGLAGKQGEKSFGPPMTAKLKGYAAGMIGIGTAVAAVTKAFQYARNVANQAGARMVEAIGGRRALLQIAGTRAEFAKLTENVDRLRTRFGLAADEAYRVTFAAASAGREFLQSTRLLGRLTEIKFDPEAAIEAAQKVQAAFGGTGAGAAGGGTFRQIINKLLAAAGPSPVPVTEIARAISVASASWRRIGGGDEPLTAMIGIMSEVFKTPLAAAERLKSLADVLAKKTEQIEFAGGPLRGLELALALPRLAREGRLRSPGGERLTMEKFIAESNAMQAISMIMEHQERILRRTEEVAAAERETGRDDLLARRLAVGKTDMGLVAVKTMMVAREERARGEERGYGSAKLMADAIVDSATSAMDKAGYARLFQYPWRAAAAVQRFLFTDAAFVQSMRRAGGEVLPGVKLSTEMQQKMEEYRRAQLTSLVTPEGDIRPGALSKIGELSRTGVGQWLVDLTVRGDEATARFDAMLAELRSIAANTRRAHAATLAPPNADPGAR